jgi:hypothetical protein
MRVEMLLHLEHDRPHVRRNLERFPHARGSAVDKRDIDH